MDEKPQLQPLSACPAFTIDPLESAITNAAQAAAEADGLTLTILQHHLKKLCDMQRERLAAQTSD